MYHIANDKRCRNSAELIYKGLLACMKKKEFDRITVSDLQKESSVARTTFYRCFDNISDILYWKCDSCFYDVLVNGNEKNFPGEYELIQHYFAYWMKHSDILEMLIKINRQDIIYACHMKNAEILEKRFGKVKGLPPQHKEYFMAIRTGFTISILTAWLKNGRREKPDEIYGIIQEQIRILAENSCICCSVFHTTLY
jgi:AcrR family transcriptional regulator